MPCVKALNATHADLVFLERRRDPQSTRERARAIGHGRRARAPSSAAGGLGPGDIVERDTRTRRRRSIAMRKSARALAGLRALRAGSVRLDARTRDACCARRQ